jgi:hypothetical protein
MSLLQSLATALTAIGLFGGCYTGIETEPQVSFDLPEGWTLLRERPGYIAVLSDGPSKIGTSPQVKLETMPQGVLVGGEQDAEEYIKAFHEQRSPGEITSEWPANEYLTADLPSGATIYADISPDIFWSAPDSVSWSSVLAYTADGNVIVMYLGDRADLYIDELDLIARSTKVRR